MQARASQPLLPRSADFLKLARSEPPKPLERLEPLPELRLGMSSSPPSPKSSSPPSAAAMEELCLARSALSLSAAALLNARLPRPSIFTAPPAAFKVDFASNSPELLSFLSEAEAAFNASPLVLSLRRSCSPDAARIKLGRRPRLFRFSNSSSSSVAFASAAASASAASADARLMRSWKPSSSLDSLSISRSAHDFLLPASYSALLRSSRICPRSLSLSSSLCLFFSALAFSSSLISTSADSLAGMSHVVSPVSRCV
mmetsp:Transcript_89626/g.256055  ORF Transcript_89626/g.256055 Transcript_89626/m.256055 type:complete len:257 (-) Transcript_89626:7065-7835(-)